MTDVVDAAGGTRSAAAPAAARTSRAQWSLVWRLLVLAGAALRLPGLADSPNQSSAMRQYHVGLLARWFSQVLDPSVPEWSRSAGEAAARRAGVLEVPLIPSFAALVNTVLGGGELHWWPMKLLVATAWIVGACCMRSVATRLAGSVFGGTAAGAVFLFAPFGLELSRSIQPDALMVGLVAISWWALLEADRQPSRRRYAVLAIALGLASASKGVGLFFTLPMVASVSAARVGVRCLWRDRLVQVSVAATLLPLAGFYLASILSGSLESQLSSSSIPSLLTSTDFWRGWSTMTLMGIGAVGVVAIAAGAYLAAGPIRHAMAWLGAGYLAYGLVFNYRISTHPYYSLPLVLLLALGVAGVVTGLRARAERAPMTDMLGVLVVVATLLVSAPWPANAYRSARPETVQATARAVGEFVEHSTDVVMLTNDYCMGPFFDAQVSGFCWPNLGDVRLERLTGAPSPDPRERLAGLIEQGAEWFVVDDADLYRNGVDGEFDVLFAELDRFGPSTRIDRAEVFRIG